MPRSGAVPSCAGFSTDDGRHVSPMVHSGLRSRADSVKPSGLLSVPGRGPENHDSLSVRVQAQFPDALIVHRLDMGTSGLLVMARGIEAQRTLSQHFAERRTRKRYVAIAQGELPQRADWSTIDAPLIVDWWFGLYSGTDGAVGILEPQPNPVECTFRAYPDADAISACLR